MTLRRYRSAADMPPPTPAASPLEGLAAACALSKASRLFGHEIRAPRGLRRFRSVAQADAHRRAWESARGAAHSTPTTSS